MADKDILEKALENKPKVFADIINAYRFHGKQVIRAEDLTDLLPRSMTPVSGDIPDQERDVFKFWKGTSAPGVFMLGRFGLENQTAVHPFMGFRVIGYDGAAYHEQALTYDSEKRKPKDERVPFTPVPIWSYVLYFGITPWSAARSLHEIFDLSNYPKELQEDFQDYGYRVIQVAFSTQDEIDSLQSDFKYVAQALETEYPYEVSNLIMAILRSGQFGKEVEERLKKGGCTMFDYVADYAAKTGAQVFWHAVYDLMNDGYTEDRALKTLDSDGKNRAKYPRPNNFPSCFAQSA